MYAEKSAFKYQISMHNGMYNCIVWSSRVIKSINPGEAAFGDFSGDALFHGDA
jgi:hypothetical protein